MEQVAKFNIGSPVIIELNTDECFTGKFQYISNDKKRIELTDVYDLVAGKKLQGKQIYYKPEILSIRAFRDESEINSIDSISPSSTSDDDNVVPTYAGISAVELDLIKQQISKAIYISRCDRVYHEALDDLRKQEFIGLSVEGSNLGRLKPASLLAFSTSDNIYIFDILSLGNIFPEMKTIMENPRPRKITHDSSKVADLLKHRYKCDLVGTFDTLIAHILIEKDKNYISLEDCLKRYLRLPEIFANIPKNIDWMKRPIENDLLNIAARNVVYLVKLYLFMAHDILLRPLSEMSQKFSTTYSSNEDQVDVFHNITTKKNPGLSEINENGLDDLFSTDLSDI